MMGTEEEASNRIPRREAVYAVAGFVLGFLLCYLLVALSNAPTPSPRSVASVASPPMLGPFGTYFETNGPRERELPRARIRRVPASSPAAYVIDSMDTNFDTNWLRGLELAPIEIHEVRDSSPAGYNLDLIDTRAATPIILDRP